MGIKTNELNQVTSVLNADSIIADTDANGTVRVPFSVATELFKDTFMAGGVPYGKELTESWSSLKARIASGNFAGLHIGDYKNVTLTGGEVVVMEVAGIDQYYKCGDTSIGHHVDFISRDCLAGTKQFNTTNNNNGKNLGTAEEPNIVKNPWLASQLYVTLNDDTEGVFSKLPAELQGCIIQKRALLEERYDTTVTGDAVSALTADTGWSWQNMGKLWIPTEVEVFGHHTWSEPGYGTGGGGCNLQYPIFFGGAKHIIKGAGRNGSRCDWWEASARRDGSTSVCLVSTGGSAGYNAASITTIYAPLCFRIG